MIKLSELGMDTMLTVQHQNDGDMDVMTKQDYLDSAYFLDYPVEPFTAVTVAAKSIVKFNLYDTLHHAGEDEMYEDWYDDVVNALEAFGPEIDTLTTKINKVLANNPTWWEGEPVEIDMLPPDGKRC